MATARGPLVLSALLCLLFTIALAGRPSCRPAGYESGFCLTNTKSNENQCRASSREILPRSKFNRCAGQQVCCAKKIPVAKKVAPAPKKTTPSRRPRGSPAPKTPTRAPRKTNAPRKTAPTPRNASTAPRKSAPTPRKSAPTPRKVAPTPRKVAPTPRNPSTAPRNPSTAPRRPAPVPKKASPPSPKTGKGPIAKTGKGPVAKGSRTARGKSAPPGKVPDYLLRNPINWGQSQRYPGFSDVANAAAEQENLLDRIARLDTLPQSEVARDPALARMREAQNSWISLPVYGNYCGPKSSGPGQPVDAVDRLCMIHDYCYASRGYFKCSCDKALTDALAAVLIRPGLSADAKSAGGWIKSFYTTMTCRS